MLLNKDFFAVDPIVLAKKLLGKIICVKHQLDKSNKFIWLRVQIVETESYYINEKGSHASLGFTQKRRALFMPPGTIYMYYARGGDSLNVSAEGEGNAVLIKAAVPFLAEKDAAKILSVIQQLNPPKNKTAGPRPWQKLCKGQTLLCKSLGLKVKHWDAKQFDPTRFYFADVGFIPTKIIQTTRLGIPKGRDEHLLYRFIDYDYAAFATQNPLTKRNWILGENYFVVNNK
jgi:DNA-3-methyladenine glycosylase